MIETAPVRSRQEFDRKQRKASKRHVDLAQNGQVMLLLRPFIIETAGEPKLRTQFQLVDIKGAIITIDAMGTQKAIAAEIIDKGADYILALKGNQETIHNGVINYLVKQGKNDFADVVDARVYCTEETGHGREERRTFLQMPVPEDLPGANLVEIDWHGDV